jgi:hypothetical protein
MFWQGVIFQIWKFNTMTKPIPLKSIERRKLLESSKVLLNLCHSQIFYPPHTLYDIQINYIN